MSMLFKRIKDWATSATEADLVAGNYLALDGSAGTKKLPANIVPACKIIDRGQASVSTLNGLTFKQDGWKYFLTDGGTLSAGSLGVKAGEEVVWSASQNKWVPLDTNFGVDSDFIEFEQGNLYLTGGNAPSTTRIRTKNYLKGNIKFRLPYGFFVSAICYYDETTLAFDSIVNNVARQYVEIGKVNCVARFVVRKIDGTANFTPDEVCGYNDKFLTVEKFNEYVANQPDELPCQKTLLEFGALTIQGKNDLYMANDLFIHKRSKTFFRLKKGDTIPFNCILFGYDKDFSFIGLENYTSGSPVNKDYSWLKVVVEKTIVENDESISWEQGYLTAGQPVYSDYYVRTDFLDFSVFKNYYIKGLSNNPLFGVYCYDSNKNFITGRSYGYRQVPFRSLLNIGDFVQNQEDVAYIKLSFHYTPEKITRPVQAYNLVHVGALQTNANFDSVNSIEVLENVKNDANGYNVVRFSYPLYYSKGRSILEPTMDSSQYDSTVYRNSGLLRLPYNYTQKGQPCPLLIFVHPSDQMQTLNGNNDFFASYASFWDYVQKEGFALMDCYHTANKYNVFAHDWGQPLAGACYEQAFKWVIENYNIDPNRVFVSSKSQGGIRALLMALGFSSIPVKACGPLAPALGLCPQFGYNKNDFTVVSDDCEFEGTMPDISNYTESDFDYSQTMPEELKDYVDANKEKIVGINPFMTNCLSCAAVDLFDKLKTHGYTNADFLSTRRFGNAPIKMWHAADDGVSGGINAHKAFIFQLQNCGCNAEIRVMPAGTGGHGAVSYADNSIRVPSLTTRLGYVCTNIPLAMVELVNWFIKNGG